MSIIPIDSPAQHCDNTSSRIKAVVIIEDGIVITAFASSPLVDIEVVDYDRDRDSRDELEAIYTELNADQAMREVIPTITHPCESDDQENCSRIHDDDLLCKQGDIIDNSVFALITAIANGTDYHYRIIHAVNSLCVDLDDYKRLPEDKWKDFCDSVISAAKEHMEHFCVTCPNPEWNSSAIGALTDTIEGLLTEQGINVCHPWEDDDEFICYSTVERCTYCKRNKHTGE